MKNLNENIIREIIQKLPEGKSPVSYLMELLHIGKETAYRRLKGQIYFTFEEIAVIANDLDFSLDKIIGQKDWSCILFDMPDTTDFSDLFVNLLKYDIKIMKDLNNAKDSKTIVQINTLPLVYFPFKHLFKFEYYQYLHSQGDSFFDIKFSDVIISPELEQLHQEAVYHFSHLKNITCIVDDGVFVNIVKSIQYYYQRNLISDEDYSLFRKELIDLLTLIEKITRTGVNDFGTNYSVYISLFHIDNNCFYHEYDGNFITQIRLSPNNSIVIKDNITMNKIQKKWLETRIKYAILITKSNDMLQYEIKKELFNYINSLDQKIPYNTKQYLSNLTFASQVAPQVID
ncbi:hypothetical protein FACS18947_0160 [Bacteroidia bacterium]|nr:hypothetical protein FACS18947_0160 [Bacteroidia bacterium]